MAIGGVGWMRLKGHPAASGLTSARGSSSSAWRSSSTRCSPGGATSSGGQRGPPHPRRAAAPALRHDPVHRLRGDVLRRLVLGLFRRRLFPTRRAGPRARAADRRHWPPKGIEVLRSLAPAALNTLILLLSGTTVTWAHHALLHNDRKGLKRGLALTVVLGVLFTAVQAYEYMHAPSASPATSTAPPSSWRPASTASTSSSAPSSCSSACSGRCRATSRRSSISASRRRLVLALRRRGLAVPVRLHLRLGLRLVGPGDGRCRRPLRPRLSSMRKGGLGRPFLCARRRGHGLVMWPAGMIHGSMGWAGR
jgi:hypothetical protein